MSGISESDAVPEPDVVYECGECGQVFVDAQIKYERHLYEQHDRLRDTLPAIMEG